MKRLLSALFAVAFVLCGIALAGCDSGANSPSQSINNFQQRVINPNSAEVATGLELFADADLSVAEPLAAVNASFSPATAQVKVWAETDVVSFVEDPEEIEDTWLVKFKPKRQGAFTIYAQSGYVKKSITIKVSAKAASVEISGNSEPIDPGKKIRLTAKTNPPDSISTITWASSDDSVATVDQNGNVTAVAPGEAVITATASDEDSGVGGSLPVTGRFDVTVKGFFLSEKYIYLCNKDVCDEVEAKLVGVDGEVSWTSSDTNLFTVANASGLKNKLYYKPGAKGKGTLTAKLTTSAGEPKTATATVIVAKYYMLALGDSIAAGYAPKPMGGKGKDEDLAQKDMIAAYEEYMNRRKGGTDPNYVNKFSYPAVLKENLSESANITLQSYARTGDQTKDLLAKLSPNYSDAEIATKKGEILEAVKQADYITLCIGANDILQRATGINIFMKDLNWFRETFTSDLEKFKTNFDTILGTLTDNGATVYVMSVYSPYYYFKESPPIPDTQYTPLYKSTTEKIVKINRIAERFLGQLNSYISSKAAVNPYVVYVDVADVINKEVLSKHKELIHADPTKFNLDALVSTFGQTIPIWFDPHPTIKGAEEIADTYKGKFTTTP